LIKPRAFKIYQTEAFKAKKFNSIGSQAKTHSEKPTHEFQGSEF